PAIDISTTRVFSSTGILVVAIRTLLPQVAHLNERERAAIGPQPVQLAGREVIEVDHRPVRARPDGRLLGLRQRDLDGHGADALARPAFTWRHRSHPACPASQASTWTFNFIAPPMHPPSAATGSQRPAW